MGLPFHDLVHPQELPWSDLAGRRLAVDGNNAIYQFLATIRQADGQPFSDPQGRTTSHLIGLFYRTTSILSQGVRPVWVFDGKPPELKAGTLRARFLAKERAAAEWKEAIEKGDLETARKKASQTSRFTPAMAAEAVELLKALGVPTVQAPSEGEAQAARMASAGLVWASASQDYDSLLFGTPRLVRGLAARQRRGDPTAAQIIDRETLLKELGLSEEELLLVGLLVGTDFNDGVTGYGPKKALKLAQRHLGWTATLSTAGLAIEEANEVAEIFRKPPVVEAGELSFRDPDDAAVERLLVEGHGFSEERVRTTLRRTKVARATVAAAGPADGRKQSLLDAFGEAP